MSDSGKENPASTQEQRYLRHSLRRIIIGQEIGPRSPRWRAAWKRTLLNYADRLGQLSAKSNKGDQAT
jgi:hypothetical protein